MPKVLKIKNVGQVKNKIKNFFSAHEDARFVRRLDVIALICDDHPIHYVAALFGINPTTVQRWVHRINESGFGGLNDKSGRGRRSQLIDTDRRQLKKILKALLQSLAMSNHDGTESFYPTTWRCTMGSILKCDNASICLSTLGFLCSDLEKCRQGLIPKRKRHLKKILNEVSPDTTIELLFYDEAFFRRESTVTRGWYPRGSKTEIQCPMTFEKVGACGAVNPRNGSLYSLTFDGFDSDTFIYYLTWLLGVFKTQKKIVIVCDNASPHKSHKVKEFVEKNRKRPGTLVIFLLIRRI